jgi:HK97 family phage prohead protease
MTVTPRGWTPGTIERRFANTAPLSYSEDERAVTAVLSRGADVRRVYGTERLRITRAAINTDRLRSSGIPLLDSHQSSGINNALGKVSRVWFSPDGAELLGRLTFNDTRQGRIAEKMVARGEISGVSIGYRVDEWSVTDGNGDPVNQDHARWDDDLVYEAVRWTLLECSLVSVPADADAAIRSLGNRHFDSISEIRTRMQCRQRMYERQQMRERVSRLFDSHD